LLKAIAVTHTPGLSITLLEGVMMAKALSISLKIPLIGVNHLYGHIYSLFINKEFILPQITLLVSGGHTSLFVVNSFSDIKLKANSLDDSIGESFDKVAKMLSLGYPGGVLVENMAKKSDNTKFNFPISLSKNKDLAFSYSGLKNAVRLQIEKSTKENTLEMDKANICASFQYSAVKHLLNKVEIFFKTSTIKNFSIVGGVSSNEYLRKSFSSLCLKYNKNIFFADNIFCSDNAAMIGRYAIELYKNKIFTKHNDLKVMSRFL
jgi:N6-L-threonylcarbamoyladenine synthase